MWGWVLRGVQGFDLMKWAKRGDCFVEGLFIERRRRMMRVLMKGLRWTGALNGMCIALLGLIWFGWDWNVGLWDILYPLSFGLWDDGWVMRNEVHDYILSFYSLLF